MTHLHIPLHQANKYTPFRRLRSRTRGRKSLWCQICFFKLVELQESHQHHLHFHQGKPRNRDLVRSTYWFIMTSLCLIFNLQHKITALPYQTTFHLQVHHDDDVIMSAIASQITSLTIVYSIVYSGADQRKHQSSASLAFVWGIPRTNGQLRGKCFHLMTSSCKNTP